eukprot:gene10057-biopygen10795
MSSAGGSQRRGEGTYPAGKEQSRTQRNKIVRTSCYRGGATVWPAGRNDPPPPPGATPQKKSGRRARGATRRSPRALIGDVAVPHSGRSGERYRCRCRSCCQHFPLCEFVRDAAAAAAPTAAITRAAPPAVYRVPPSDWRNGRVRVPAASPHTAEPEEAHMP